MRYLTTAALLVGIGVFAQQPSRDPNSPTSATNPSSTIGDPHETTLKSPETAADKAMAYDKWPEKQKLEVAKATGHALANTSRSERAAALARLTQKDKVDAYDYFIAHQTKPSKKAKN